MRDLLSQARDNRGQDLFSQESSKKLEFSTISKLVYDRHKTDIIDIFFNSNINTFVSYTDKYLHTWNPKNLELVASLNISEMDTSQISQPLKPQNNLQNESPNTKIIKKEQKPAPVTSAGSTVNIGKSICCLCYSQKYNLYFACTQNFRLVVLNEHFNMVFCFEMEIRLITSLYFYEKNDQLICAGKEGCFIMDLTIENKYYPKMAILLDPKGQSTTVRIKESYQTNFEAKEQKLVKQMNQHSDSQESETLPVSIYPGKYGYNIKKLQGFNQWVFGLKIIENQNLIVAWRKENQTDEVSKTSKVKQFKDQIIFYSLNKTPTYQQGELWSKAYDPIIKDDFITDILVYKDKKIFMTGHNLGDITIRKLTELSNMEKDESGRTQMLSMPTQNKSVHVFNGHSKGVSSLAPIKNRTQFVSASTDGKVKVWCFEKLIELYCFDIMVESPVINSGLANQLQNVKLIDQNIYAMYFKGYIEIGQISHLVQSNFITKQNIVALGKCYNNEAANIANRIQNLFICFDDNSIVIYNPFENQAKCTIYPPPTPSVITQTLFCIAIQRMILLLSNGSLCVYDISQETGILEKLSKSSDLRDYEGSQEGETITAIRCCYTEPPTFDCQIFSDLYKYQEPAELEFNLCHYSDLDDLKFLGDDIDMSKEGPQLDQFLAIGLSKGTIIFVKVTNMNYIYARFSIHGERILQINEIKSKGIFLSLCTELKLNIWGFFEGKAIIHNKFLLGRQISTILVSRHQQILICFQKGDSELLVWNDEKKKLEVPNLKTWDDEKQEYVELLPNKSDEHDDKITCYDCYLKLGLIVTGDCEGIVKIWNAKKQLIRQIRFVDPINSICFLNPQGDIMIGHSGNLSSLTAKKYLDKTLFLKDEDEFAQISKQGNVLSPSWFEKKKKDLVMSKTQKIKLNQIKNQQIVVQEEKSLFQEKQILEKSELTQSVQCSEPNKNMLQMLSSLKETIITSQKLKQSTNYDRKQSNTFVDNSKKISAQNSIGIDPVSEKVSDKNRRKSFNQKNEFNLNSTPTDSFIEQPYQKSQNTKQSARDIDNRNYLRDDISRTNSSMIDPPVKPAIEMDINQIRQMTTNTPSVPISFIKTQTRNQQNERRRLQSQQDGTRRNQTLQRITQNIQRNNNPGNRNDFSDILMTQTKVVTKPEIVTNNFMNFQQDLNSSQTSGNLNLFQINPLMSANFHSQNNNKKKSWLEIGVVVPQRQKIHKKEFDRCQFMAKQKSNQKSYNKKSCKACKLNSEVDSLDQDLIQKQELEQKQKLNYRSTEASLMLTLKKKQNQKENSPSSDETSLCQNTVSQNDPKKSKLQSALQLMATSATTFSVYDNFKFEPQRIKNFRMEKFRENNQSKHSNRQNFVSRNLKNQPGMNGAHTNNSDIQQFPMVSRQSPKEKTEVILIQEKTQDKALTQSVVQMPQSLSQILFNQDKKSEAQSFSAGKKGLNNHFYITQMNFDKKNNAKQKKEKLMENFDNRFLNQPLSQEYTFDGSQATAKKEHSAVSQSLERFGGIQQLTDISENLKLSPEHRIRVNRPAEFGKMETDSAHYRFNSTLHKSQVSNVQRTFQDLALDSEVASHRKINDNEKERKTVIEVDRKSIAFGSSDLRYESGMGQKHSDGSSPKGIDQNAFSPHAIPMYEPDNSPKKLQIKVNKNKVIHETTNYSQNVPNRLAPFEEKSVRHTVLIPEKSIEQFQDVIYSGEQSNKQRTVILPFAQNTEQPQMKNRYFTPNSNENQAGKNNSTYSAPSIAIQNEDDKEQKESTISLEVKQVSLERVRKIHKQDRFGNTSATVSFENKNNQSFNGQQSFHGQKSDINTQNYSPDRDYGAIDGLQPSVDCLGNVIQERISFSNELSTSLPQPSQLKDPDEKSILGTQTLISSKITNLKDVERVVVSKKEQKNEIDEFKKLGNQLKKDQGTRNEMGINQYSLMEQRSKKGRILIKPTIISNQNLRVHEIPPELLLQGLGNISQDTSKPNQTQSQNYTATQDSIDQSMPISPVILSTVSKTQKNQLVNFNQTQNFQENNYLLEKSQESGKMLITEDNLPRKLRTAQCSRGQQMIKKSQELLDKQNKRQTYLLVVSGKQEKMRTQSGMLTRSRGLALMTYKEKMKNLELLHHLKQY